MDLTAEAIDKIIDLSEVDEITHGGRFFTDKQVLEIKPLSAETVTVHSLQALVDYLNMDSGDFDERGYLVHVVDPYRVDIVSGSLDATYRNRELFMTAKRIHKEFEFGRYFQQEEMVMNLMTLFEGSAVLDDVIKAVSGLVVSQEVQVNDDGISQDIQVRKGASRIEKLTIKNPILLQPIRTFTEVEQVEAPYVLRIREAKAGTPEIAIFEAGGGQWKNDAICEIKAWLSEQVEGAKILG